MFKTFKLMRLNRQIAGTAIVILLFFLSSCGPKSTTTDPELIRESSKAWIPFAGEEHVQFFNDTSTIVFTGMGKESYYENRLYMSDQSGFFTYQQDYYADLERQELYFTSSSSDYFIHYLLEKGKGESGDWDILRVQLADGNYYTNDMKIVVYETDSYDKGEYFLYKDQVTLNGNEYSNVYYNTQEQRPFEIYYTKESGIVAFKIAATEIWTIDPDNLKN